MKPRAIYKLAVVLTKSQLRGYQRSRLTSRIFGDPKIVLALDIALIAGLGALSHVVVSTILPDTVQRSVREIEVEALAGIPAALTFAVILFGVVAEISQSIQSMSTDLVNWLPISPIEYVSGSILSLSYTYSFMLSFFLGLALGPAILFGMVAVWLGAGFMAILSLLIGACVIEMLRAITNRITSSFYRKSGRSGIFARLLITIVVLVFIQLLFSGRIIVFLLQSVIQTAKAAWFVPAVWPSLAVLSVSQGSIAGLLLFGSLSIVFLLVLFGLAVNFRDRFWVPVPISVKLTAQAYRPLARHNLSPIMDTAELAIFRKDLRSLTRRREMARYLAIPFVVMASLGISLVPLSGSSLPEGPGFFATIPLYLIPIATICGIISMTSIGQEGYAVWQLYTAPLNARQLLKPKLLVTMLIGIGFTVGLAVVLGLFLKIVVDHFLVLFILGMAVVLEESALGLYFGARFPDFRETIRSRYVTIWGSLIGMLLGIVLTILTASPVLLSILVRPSATSQSAVIAFAIGLIVFSTSWKLAQRQAKRLLENIRI